MNKKELSNPVFIISLILVGALAIWSVAGNASFAAVANVCFSVLTTDFGWLYLIAMLVFLFFVLYCAFGKFGKIRLGSDDSRPEFKNFTWFGLLFGCGMGVGLVFYGVAEPLTHYLYPQAGTGIEAATPGSADFAISSFFMHWGILPWANYAVVGLALAYFMYRKNRPGLISVMLEPLIGKKLANGWLGKVIDIIGVFATVAAVVTSLGLGCIQINTGLNYLFGLPNTLLMQIIIIAIITVIYTGSAVSGIEKGMKIISDTNLYIAIGLLIACFLIGPMVADLNSLVQGLGNYINDFFTVSLGVSAYDAEANTWLGSWKLFYWAWFIAWAPFVGVFVAKISKGRTIREFVLGVALVPAIASCVWGAVMGNLGINLVEIGTMTIEAAQEAVADPSAGLFVILQQYYLFGIPVGYVLCFVALASLLFFFVTSANSGVYVLSMLSSEGNPDPSSFKKMLWGIIVAVVCIGLLMAGGGGSGALKPLQTISLVAAFPFMFVMFGICAAFKKTLNQSEEATVESQRLELLHSLEENDKAPVAEAKA